MVFLEILQSVNMAGFPRAGHIYYVLLLTPLHHRRCCSEVMGVLYYKYLSWVLKLIIHSISFHFTMDGLSDRNLEIVTDSLGKLL